MNDDLNKARAIALTWELVKSDLSTDIKKATLMHFDEVLGLRLGKWQSTEILVPENVRALSEQRELARSAKRWEEADRFRGQIYALGFEIEDTPTGPQLKPKDRH